MRWALTIFALLCATGFLSDEFVEALRWTRDTALGQEPYRWLTGHFMHLDRGHAALNAGGFLLVWWWLHDSLHGLRGLLVTIVAILVIDLGLWHATTFDWYVGASGWIHALAAAGITYRSIYGDRLAFFIGLLGLAKLAAENPSPSLLMQDDAVLVATVAHWCGVAAGISCALGFALHDGFFRKAARTRK